MSGRALRPHGSRADRVAAFVRFTCSTDALPCVGRFEHTAPTAWALVAASPQRPGTPATAGVSHGLEGVFMVGAGYGGCPRCRAPGFVKCGVCAELGCWDSSWVLFSCPVCGNSGPVSGDISSLQRTD